MANGPHSHVGRYACKVVSQALGEASTGNPQFALRFTVMGMVDPADPSRFIPSPQQYERTHYRTITEKTVPYFVEDLKLLGFTGTSFRELDPNADGFHDFRDMDVDMWCSHEKGQDGSPREKWGVARKGGSELDIKPLESKKVRELDNLFGKHLKGMKAAQPAPAPITSKPAPAAEAGITDDDIPF